MNKEEILKVLAKISILVFAYLVIYYFYSGFIIKTYEGDSLNYHIPIAKAFLDGTILNPKNINGQFFLRYYPGSSEAIISLLLLMKLPMNIFNVLGLVVLFLVLIFSGKRFGLGNFLSVIFATSVVSLHGIVRWINTQVIDIWLLAFFMLALSLLQKPSKKISYFLLLGLTSGMLIGSKYTGIVYLLFIFVFNFKKLLKLLNPKRIIAFLVPFIIVGALWYVRNYLVIGDPFYPVPFLGFKGRTLDFGNNVLKSFFYPNGVLNFINGFISEYGIWAISIFTPLILLNKKIRKAKEFKIILMLTIISLLNFLVYLMLFSDKYYNIVVSVFRYTYVCFVPLILVIFIISKKLNKEMLVAFFAFAGFLIIPELKLYPKLIFIFIPVALVVFYFEKIWDFMKDKARLKGGK